MKSQNQKLYKFLITPTITAIIIILCIGFCPLNGKAKTCKPKWKKQPSSLEVGKTYHYRIKSCPKNAVIQFSSNHTSLAGINRKTGLLRAKKAGNVIITAKIKQSQKKTKKLKTRIRIIKKKNTSTDKNKISTLSTDTTENKEISNQSPILNHVSFSIAESINPWNHSIMLYSSRILLQSEVQNTDLTLTPSMIESNSKTNTPLKAYFSSLSADGKTITYQLNEDSSKKLCPGNGTLDGEYEITSNFFSSSLRTQYHERIHENCICGFVLNSSQTSLANVSIQLYINSQNTPIASTITDKNGYYEFQNITDKNITLKAESENYNSYSLSSLNPAGQTICQNIIMHPISTKNLVVSCQILNKQNQAAKNTAVILTTKDADFTGNTIYSPDKTFSTDDKTTNFFLQGFVDANGIISFANQETINADNYTQISCHPNQSLPVYLHGKMPVSDSIIQDPLHVLTRNQDYILYVFPTTDGTAIPRDYQMESFSFSFDSLLSDSLFLQIQLQDLPSLNADKVSIQSDTLTDSVSSYHYTLYDKKGNELFQTTLSPSSKENQNDYSKQLTTALQADKIRLTDGDYFAAITAFSSDSSEKSDYSNEKETPISGTTILSVQIQNNTISPADFSLSPCQTMHALSYIDNYNENLENISFILYQKKDTLWFPIGTYTTDSFTSIHSGQKAYLNLPVSPGTDYYLNPLSTKYQINSGNYFTIPEEQKNMMATNTSKQENMTTINTSEQEDLIPSHTPEHQIILDFVSDHETNRKDALDLSGLLDYVYLCTNITFFHKDFFDNSTTYPNTVYAYYQTDGSFANLLLATPSFSYYENNSSTFIYNRLQNGTAILTSQPSYSTTAFFVT